MSNTRVIEEQIFHDRQAAQRAESFRGGLAELSFKNSEFLDHASWIRPAIKKLGPLRNIDLLDYGCGHGMAAVVFARLGARVTAFDLSPGYVEEARNRFLANGIEGNYLAADGEQLPFADASFDAVWGNAVLHHLDLLRAGAELFRVMKPGGVAVFCEPWGGNPFLNFARRHLPYPGKNRTPDEQPLVKDNLSPLRTIFSSVEFEGFQLLEMASRVYPSRWLCGKLSSADRVLFKQFPSLQNWCRYVVIVLRK